MARDHQELASTAVCMKNAKKVRVNIKCLESIILVNAEQVNPYDRNILKRVCIQAVIRVLMGSLL